jgi:hypothetical protein
MPAKEAYQVLRRAELEGKMMLAAEQNTDGGLRVLLYFPPDGKRGDVDYELNLTEEQLLQRHANYLKRDYNVLYVRKNPAGTYTGFWIVSERLGVALRRLNELGISAPSIRLKESPAVASAPVATTAAVVSTPMREWRDKTGRPLQASVSGVENGTVNFVRPDGRKIPYPLADLSETDQKYIAELQAKSAEGASGAGDDAEGFSKWMSRADFDSLMSDQQGNGLVPIYAESNFRNEMRAVFVRKPEPWGYYLGWTQPEQTLREQHASYKSQEFTLLTLSHDRRSDTYCAVWVGPRALENGKALLAKLGITQASIDGKITMSEVSKR